MNGLARCVCVAAFVPEALLFPATMGCVGRDSVKRCERFTRPHGECVHTFVFVYLPRTFFRVCTCGNFGFCSRDVSVVIFCGFFHVVWMLLRENKSLLIIVFI